MPGCVSYMGSITQHRHCLGLGTEVMKRSCLHPASISVTKPGQGKHKPFKGQWTGSQEHINTARMLSSLLPENQPKNSVGRAGRALCQQPQPALPPLQGQQQRRFSTRGSEEGGVCSAGSQEESLTSICSLWLVGHGNLGLSCTQKGRS